MCVASVVTAPAGLYLLARKVPLLQPKGVLIFWTGRHGRNLKPFSSDLLGGHGIELVFGRGDHNVSECHATFFRTLQIDGTGRSFVAVECAPGDARDLFVIDDGYAVLNDRHGSSDECNIEGLPLIRDAGLFRSWIQESVHSSRMMARRFRYRIRFDLNFI